MNSDPRLQAIVADAQRAAQVLAEPAVTSPKRQLLGRLMKRVRQLQPIVLALLVTVPSDGLWNAYDKT